MVWGNIFYLTTYLTVKKRLSERVAFFFQLFVVMRLVDKVNLP